MRGMRLPVTDLPPYSPPPASPHPVTRSLAHRRLQSAGLGESARLSDIPRDSVIVSNSLITYPKVCEIARERESEIIIIETQVAITVTVILIALRLQSTE